MYTKNIYCRLTVCCRICVNNQRGLMWPTAKDNCSVCDQWSMCVNAKSHSMTFGLVLCVSLGLDDVKGQGLAAQIVFLCIIREDVWTSARAKASQLQLTRASSKYGIVVCSGVFFSVFFWRWTHFRKRCAREPSVTV